MVNHPAECRQAERLPSEPGGPDRRYAESFHSRRVDEFLSQEEFEGLRTARQLTQAWREDYNHHRPHSSLGYVTPEEFATRWADDAENVTDTWLYDAWGTSLIMRDSGFAALIFRALLYANGKSKISLPLPQLFLSRRHFSNTRFTCFHDPK